MHKQRLFLLVLTVLLVLTACRQEAATTEPAEEGTAPAAENEGNASSEDATDSVEEPTPIPATPTPSDPLAQIDPTGQTLRLFHGFEGSMSDAIDGLVSSFNSSNEQGITVKVVPPVEDDAEVAPSFEEQLQAADAQLVLATAPPASLAESLLDMSPYATSPTWGDGAAAVEEPLTSIELAVATEALYFNSDLMAELGISEPPTTWQALEEAACQAGERIGFVYPYQLAAGEPSHSAALVASRGGTIADEDTLSLDNDVSRTTFAELQRLYEAGCIGPVVEQELVLANFGAGNILFVADASTHQTAYEQAVSEGYGGSWGIAPLPRDEGGQLLTSGVALSALSASEEQNLASWLFAQWLQAPEQRSALAQAAGLIVPDAAGDALSAALLEGSQPDPTAPFSDDVRAIIEEGTAQIVDQGADVDLTLTDLTSEVQYWIAER